MQLIPILDEHQRRQMLQLLAEGFPGGTIDWSSAFKAPPGTFGHGYLLMVNQQLAGGILVFEKTETIRGQPRRVVNLSSWYIRPPYRKYAVRMVREICADQSAIYTTFSPIPSVQKIAQRIGYRYVSQGSIASAPFINGMISKAGISVEPYSPGLVTNPEHDRWMRDHSDERHIGLLIRSQSDLIPTLWLRGFKIRGLPAARLLFAADHQALRAAMPGVHWQMLKAHGIVFVYLPRIARYADFRSIRKPGRGPCVMVRGDISDEDVNLLYSELLYLPES